MDTQPIGTLVRSWIHYQNLATSCMKQSLAARKVKEQFESQVITTLQHQGMMNAVIQTNSGRITVADRREANPLSISKVEELLHAYFRQRGGRDETLEIMTFLRANRGYTTSTYLKQSGGGSAPALPTPL